MPGNQELSITLPTEMAEAVKEKVRSGAYASVSEVVREGVHALLDRDSAVDRWLRDEVAQGCEEMATDPSRAISAEDILPRLRSRLAASREA